MLTAKLADCVVTGRLAALHPWVRRAAGVLATLLPCSLLAGCAPSAPQSKLGGSADAVPATGSDFTTIGPTTQWQTEIFSPRTGPVPLTLEGLQARCGRADTALAQVANAVLAWPDFDADPDAREYFDFAMRAAGVAYVWPRAWSKRVAAADAGEEQVRVSLDRWLASFHDGGERRCGLARASTDRTTTYAAVVVDVLADVIDPFPTRARTGQWLELNVQLLETATDAKVVREGPTGEPTFLPTTLTGDRVRARFPMATPGRWLVQVMAMMSGGPRPVADLLVFVDEPAPTQLRFVSVPGESAEGLGSNVSDSLFLMLNRARVEEGRKPLKRNADLDRLALEHTRAMLGAGHTGHDVGDGLPDARISAAGLQTTLIGENVVRAADARRAHRELWASPSHRSAILHRGFRNVGVGALTGPDRTVWACELFAALD